MDMVIYIVIISCFVIAWIYYFNCRDVFRAPPGLLEIPLEKGLPVIGVLRNVGGSLCNYLYELSQRHGPIYRIRLGMRDIVVLNTYEYIKEATVTKGDAFSGRWNLLGPVTVAYGKGVAFVDGNTWAKQRDFSLKTLTKLGMGRSRSEEIVHKECLGLLEDLERMKGTCVDLFEFLPLYTANIVGTLVMSRRFTRDDSNLATIREISKCILKEKDALADTLFLFPVLDRFEWLVRFITWITSRTSLFDKGHRFIEDTIKSKLNSLDINFEGEDLIDRFLIAQHQLKKRGSDLDTFTDFQLVRISIELFVAGNDTITSTFVWSFMLLAMYPEVQKKVYEEIIERIGNERLPNMSDKKYLNYTQAVIDEILRLSSVVPLPIFHRTLENISLDGYFIPKDTIIAPNQFACNFDPNNWERPNDFYPEHFLSMTSDGCLKYNPNDKLLFFGIGKRQCLGESLVRTEFFIFFTSVIQRFQVSLTREVTNIQDVSAYIDSEGVIRSPKIKDFIFRKRKY